MKEDDSRVRFVLQEDHPGSYVENRSEVYTTSEAAAANWERERVVHISIMASDKPGPPVFTPFCDVTLPLLLSRE